MSAERFRHSRAAAESNRNLAQTVADRAFRSDLYYRLKVFPIVTPPLRERAEGTSLLVQCFTERAQLGRWPRGWRLGSH